jgi:DNA-binding sugar fermentation-stimulating protein
MLSSVSNVICLSLVSQANPAEPLGKVKAKALQRMKAAGIKIRDCEVELLSPDQAADTNYIDTMIMLHKKGVFINCGMFKSFTIEDASRKSFVAALVKLQDRAGINVRREGDEFICDKLSLDPQKADPAYINALIKLHRNGVRVNGYLVEYLSVEEAKDPEVIQYMINEAKKK